MFKPNKDADFYLFHKPTETLIEKLNWTQLHALCRSFAGEGASKFYLWSSQEDKWVRLQTVIKDILDTDEGLMRYPPSPPTDIEGEELKHQLVTKPSDSRDYKRYRRRLSFTLDCAGLLMKLDTFDISMGGIKFTQTVDLKMRAKHIYLYYTFGSEVLEFKAHPLYRDDTNSFDTVTISSCNNIQLWKKAVEWSPHKKS